MKIKVSIVDDHPLVINGLHHILGNCRDIEITGSYNNGRELMKALARKQPDVLLLDIYMPGQSGEELADLISRQYPEVKMLALTNLDNVYYVKSMLRKGVHGYILKTIKEDILLDAIRTVHSGKKYLETSLQDKLIQDALQAKQELSVDPVLSTREKEILSFIAVNLTSQQIADKLSVSKRTIDFHRTSLLMKLGVKNVAALVKKAIQLGLIE